MRYIEIFGTVFLSINAWFIWKMLKKNCGPLILDFFVN